MRAMSKSSLKIKTYPRHERLAASPYSRTRAQTAEPTDIVKIYDTANRLDMQDILEVPIVFYIE